MRAPYDPNLQMFVDAPRECDPAHLTFLRYLADSGQYDSRPVSLPAGSFADVTPLVLSCPFCNNAHSPGLLPGDTWECPNDGMPFVRVSLK